MLERQPCGMQRLPRHAQRRRAAVERVGHQRMPARGQVHADLVGAPGVQGAAQGSEATARRDVLEEIGLELAAQLAPLGEVRQAGGKLVTAFAAEQDFDPSRIVSNTFDIEWPPKSGKMLSFPEIDAAQWMSVSEARTMMLASQQPLLDRLLESLPEAKR